MPCSGSLALVTLVADQASKIWALDTLEPGVAKPFIGQWISTPPDPQQWCRLLPRQQHDRGFSPSCRWSSLAAILASLRRITTGAWAATIGLLLGGAAGNLVDRVFRAPGLFRGHVVDFLDYFGLFIGNVADIAIVVAAGLVVILSVRSPHPEDKGEPTAYRSDDD
jgi:signal peptidase II